MDNIKIAKELVKIAKQLKANYYGWDNPTRGIEVFTEFLRELLDALNKNDKKLIKKALGKIENYGKAVLLTKDIYNELLSIIESI